MRKADVNGWSGMTRGGPGESAGELIETALPGGLTGAVRIGDTVRRPMGPWSPAVHALLRHLELKGFEGAPRVLGIDESGREILSYLPGRTVLEANSLARASGQDAILREAGGLLRRYHDAVSDLHLPASTRWRYRCAGTEPGMIVCHNDLAPRNAIWQDDSRGRGPGLAFIDWDWAAPHRPLWDAAHAAWQFIPLQPDSLCERLGWPEPPDRRHRYQLFCEAYGISSPAELLSLVSERIAASRDGIRRFAAAGDPSCQRLLAEGHDRDMDDTLSFLRQIQPMLLR